MKQYTAGKTMVREYDSIGEFTDAIHNTPLNEVFRWEKLSSANSSGRWAGTSSYPEAEELLKHGADDLAKKIERSLQLKSTEIGTKPTQRSIYDVAGYQASVPRYLQGIPTSMVNSKKVPQKQPVITLNKSMNYAAWWSADEIIEESTKALVIIKKIELSGTRVNLNLCFVSEVDGQSVGLKIRVKNASERMNVSKMAFLLAHPAMLRRIIFRWLETNPDVTSKKYASGYGRPGNIANLAAGKEYTLPEKIGNMDDFIQTLKNK